jgi:hypothetical protein
MKKFQNMKVKINYNTNGAIHALRKHNITKKDIERHLETGVLDIIYNPETSYFLYFLNDYFVVILNAGELVTAYQSSAEQYQMKILTYRNKASREEIEAYVNSIKKCR